MRQLQADMITMAQDAIVLVLALVRATLQQLGKEVADLLTTKTSTDQYRTQNTKD